MTAVVVSSGNQNQIAGSRSCCFASVLVVLWSFIRLCRLYDAVRITREFTSSRLLQCLLESGCVRTEINLSEEKRAGDGRHVKMCVTMLMGSLNAKQPI